jgi:hypothetical protein
MAKVVMRIKELTRYKRWAASKASKPLGQQGPLAKPEHCPLLVGGLGQSG